MTLFQRDIGDDMFAMTGEEYLSLFNVKCYLNDMVKQLLDCRDDKPVDFISEYFLAVLRGTHVLHRGYEYVTATHHNRAAFGLMMSLAFTETEFPKGISLGELCQLVFLVCPGFPEVMINRVYATCKQAGETKIQQLTSALSVHVYFVEFLQELERLQIPEAGASRKSVLIDSLCILARNAKKEGKMHEQPKDAVYGSQPPYYPTKEVLQNVMKSVSEKASDPEEVDGVCTMEQVKLALYSSQMVQSLIIARHPVLFSAVTPGHRVPQSATTVVDSVLQSHDSMLLSGRKRKSKSIPR